MTKSNDYNKEKKRLVLKKNFLIMIGISSVIIISGIITGIILLKPNINYVYLRVSNMWGPVELDPIGAREPPCVVVISQVAEGLFDYNETTSEIIPSLAISHSWSTNHSECTVDLRQDVKFHDGTDFNAQAVKWNFDRLYSMINQHPDLIPEARLWKLPNGTKIIQETQVIDEYTIKFRLNELYAPFLCLLTTWSAYIISPSSTPSSSLLNLSTDDLIGTGPFIYDKFIPHVEVRLSANPRYWGGKPAFDKLILKIFGEAVGNEDIEAINESLYSRELDLAPKVQKYNIFGNFNNFVDKIQSESSLLLIDDPPETSYNFIGFNNHLINVTLRKAMAYAFDYDYFLEDILDGWSIRMRSPIPKGIMYSNTEDFEVPTFNLTVARQMLIDDHSINTSGLPLDNDTPWEDLVDKDRALANLTFTYDQGHSLRASLLTILQSNFKKIGIKIIGEEIPWIQIVYRFYELNGNNRDMLDIYHLGWNADFSDPYNYINQLMSNESGDNYSQINDHLLQLWMEQAVGELNSTKREELYYKIQKRFIEDIFPWIMLDIPKYVSIQSTNIENYYPSSMLWKICLKTINFITG